MTPLIRRVIDTGEPVTGVEVVGVTRSHPDVERTWSTNFYRLDLDGDLRVGLFIEEITERADARRRSQRLASIAERLARADSTDEVAAVIADEIAEYFNARVAVVGVISPSTRSIEVLAGPHVLAAMGDVVATADDETAYGAAIRSGAPVLITDSDDRAARFGREFNPFVEASAAIPCRSSDGSVTAIMGIGWSRRIELDEFPMNQLNTMAALIGSVLERNRASDDRRNLVGSLQNTLLAEPAHIDGIEIAVRYDPAGDALGFGGDWFDVVCIDRDRTALVVGDVVGHDGVAAAHMTQIRTTFSDLLMLDTDLADIFEETNRLLAARQSPPMATISVVSVNTCDRTITALSAGHLPALIMQPSGDVEILAPALRPPLLVDAEQPALVPIAYEKGATVIMFTDGLIETRGSNIDDDLEALRRYVRAQSGVDPHTLADRLLTDFADGTNRGDDIAIVCARLD